MSFLSHSMALLATTTWLLLAPAAIAQTAQPRSTIEATYQRDRAACLDSASMHERSACLREAGAVRAEALRGRRSTGTSPEELARNAIQRCTDLTPDDKMLCERRARGEGRTTGSVAAGGVLRELEIIVPGPAPMPASTQNPIPAPR